MYDYQVSGQRRSTTKGIAQHSEFNRQVRDEEFQLEFPKGVKFSEKLVGGRVKYFVSLGNGESKEIDQAEYARIPKQK